MQKHRRSFINYRYVKKISSLDHAFIQNVLTKFGFGKISLPGLNFY